MRGLDWTLTRIGLATATMLLIGCPGVETPGLESFTGGGSTTGNSTITTLNSTIDPTLPGTDDADSAMSGTMGSGDTLDGPVTDTDPGTTTAATTATTTTTTTDPGESSTTDPGGSSTTDPGTTGMGSSGGGSSSGGGGCNSAPGDYEYCLNMAGAIDTTPCAAGNATCIYTGTPPDYAGVTCAFSGCADVCDCPAAPGTGNPTLDCSDITGDMVTECILDCSMGEACPTGMVCYAGFLCMWPGPAGMGTPYGDCFNNDNSICGINGICLNDGAMPTIGVCTEACQVVGDCAAAPPGGTSPVACSDVTNDGANECVIDCSGGTTCPTGMTCFGNNICAWT